MRIVIGGILYSICLFCYQCRCKIKNKGVLHYYACSYFGYAGFQYEYEEMRASFLMTHSPEVLGVYAVQPELKSHNEEDVRKFMEEIEMRKKYTKTFHIFI